MDVSVILVTHNNARGLAACLRALEDALTHARMAFPLRTHVIIVDNASDDATPSLAAARMPDAHILRHRQNVGFAAGVNAGVRMAAGHLWLLNPDTVVEEESLALLLHTLLAAPSIGAVGPALLRPDGSIAPESARAFPTLWHEAMDKLGLALRHPGHPLWGRYYLGHERTPRPVPVLSGAALLVRREAWDALGGLDEAFWLYGEDTDFCTRLWARGWRCVYQPRARVMHEGGGSWGAGAALPLGIMALRSMAHYMEKHRGRGTAHAYRALMAGLALLKGAYWTARGDRAHLRVQQAVLRWALTGDVPDISSGTLT